MGNAKVLKYLLDKELGGAVGVGGGKGEILLYRNACGLAVNGSARRENELEAIVIAHFVNKVKSARDVVVIIFDRHSDRFTDSLKTRKMDNGIDIVFVKYLLYALTVEKVDFVKLGTDAGNCFDMVNYLCLRIGKVIENNDLLALLNKVNAGMRADIARTAGNKYAHLEYLYIKNIVCYFKYNILQSFCQAERRVTNDNIFVDIVIFFI
jgi:hypothetical protein